MPKALSVICHLDMQICFRWGQIHILKKGTNTIYCYFYIWLIKIWNTTSKVCSINHKICYYFKFLSVVSAICGNFDVQFIGHRRHPFFYFAFLTPILYRKYEQKYVFQKEGLFSNYVIDHLNYPESDPSFECVK